MSIDTRHREGGGGEKRWQGERGRGLVHIGREETRDGREAEGGERGGGGGRQSHLSLPARLAVHGLARFVVLALCRKPFNADLRPGEGDGVEPRHL